MKAAFPKAGVTARWSVVTRKLASFMTEVLYAYFFGFDEVDFKYALRVNANDVQYGELFDKLDHSWSGADYETSMANSLEKLKSVPAGQTVVMIWDEAAAMAQRNFLVEDDSKEDMEKLSSFPLTVRPVRTPTHWQDIQPELTRMVLMPGVSRSLCNPSQATAGKRSCCTCAAGNPLQPGPCNTTSGYLACVRTVHPSIVKRLSADHWAIARTL